MTLGLGAFEIEASLQMWVKLSGTIRDEHCNNLSIEFRFFKSKTIL